MITITYNITQSPRPHYIIWYHYAPTFQNPNILFWKSIVGSSKTLVKARLAIRSINITLMRYLTLIALVAFTQYLISYSDRQDMGMLGCLRTKTQ